MLYLMINFFYFKEYVKVIDEEIFYYYCLDEEFGNEFFGIFVIRYRK